jgi:hypothetical protein
MFGVSPRVFRLASDDDEEEERPAPHLEVFEAPQGDWLQSCFYIHNVLSPEECEAMIRVCEDVGFLEVDRGKNTQGALTWVLDEESIGEALFRRCEPFLPPTMTVSTCRGGGGEEEAGGDVGDEDDNEDDKEEEQEKEEEVRFLRGLNARCRFYRYQPNSRDTFRPHRDDSSPGAGFLAGSGDRVLRWDAFGGSRASLLSFLLYLNDDFDGGETTFFPPAGGADAAADEVVSVRPRQGSVLCFPQTLKLSDRDAVSDLSPLHEGSPVREHRSDGSPPRPKHVMRSDVLYSNRWPR